jgi:hypothetical protein
MIEPKGWPHLVERAVYRFEHSGRTMPKYQGTPGSEVVDVPITVNVEKVRAVPARHEDRVWEETPERATFIAPSNASRHRLQGPLKEFLGSRAAKIRLRFFLSQ